MKLTTCLCIFAALTCFTTALALSDSPPAAAQAPPGASTAPAAGRPATAPATSPTTRSAASQPAKTPLRYIPVGYCPRTAAPPTLDGALDDECWKSAGVLEEFVCDAKDAFPTQATEVRALHDDRWVYLAFRCREADMAHQKVLKTGRAIPWDEDSVEIFLEPKRLSGQFEHYAVNVLEANNLPAPPAAPNAVVVKARAGANEWTVECRLPIAALAKPPLPDGAVWGLNVARNRNRPGGYECSSWARLTGNFEKPDLFGLLVFCDALPADRVTGIHLGERYPGDNVATVFVQSRLGGKLSLAVSSGGVWQQEQYELPVGESALGVAYALKSGNNVTGVTVTQGQQTLLATGFRIVQTLARPAWSQYVRKVGAFSIDLPRAVFAQGEAIPTSMAATLEGVGRTPPGVLWRLAGPDGSAVPAGADGQFRFDEKTPDGAAELSASLLGEEGRELAVLKRTITLAGRQLRQWEQQADDLQARIDKARAGGIDDAQLALYWDKTARKIDSLRFFIRSRQLQRAGQAAEEIAHHVECLAGGRLPVWGHHECLYRSEIDGTDQPYAVAVPKDYQPKGDDRRPMLIWLHCFWGDGPWRRQDLKAYMEAMELACMAKGVILVHPFGRGSQGYRHDGESDFWDVWNAVTARWRIDPERVYLAGFSMGGSGTARLCGQYPQLFAAGAVYSGSYPKPALCNLRYLPMRWEAGAQEAACAEMAELAGELKKVEGRRAETIFVAHPNEAHTQEYIDFEALLDWFLKHRRPPEPPVVTMTAFDLKHASNYWVRVDQFQEYGKPAGVDARLESGALKIETSNVSALTVRPPAGLIDPARPLAVIVNGRRVSPTVERGAMRLSCATQPATAASGPAGAVKTPARSGPIRDAFTAPLLLLAAASGDQNVQAAQIVAERWKNWHHGKLDVVVEAKAVVDLAARNVILVGPWPGEGLMGQLARTAPVKIDATGITVSGRKTQGKDLGIIFIQPSPHSPDRYVVVITGQSPAGVLAACRLFEQDKYDGDWTITDGSRGVFDGQWR